MGDSRAAIDGESPLGRWPSEASRQPERQRERQASGQGRQPGVPLGATGAPYASDHPQSDDRTRLDLPAYNAGAASDDPNQPNAPRDLPAAPVWPGPAAQPAQPMSPAPTPPSLTHMPWTVAASWGASSLNTPNALAGVSYLFWWVSGLWVYFNERHNRYVRFHAVQSILLTGLLTVVSVVLYILWELSGDLSAATHQPAFAHLGQGIALLGFLAVIALWLGPMFAAWSGHHLRLPIIGGYAERYSAPPREPYPPLPFDD